MKLGNLLLVSGVVSHANPDSKSNKKFMKFARKYQYHEDASIAERRAEEVSQLQKGKGKMGRHGPGGMPHRSNPEDSLRFSTLDHHLDRIDITPDISMDDLFDDGSVLLQPQVTEGPFYVGGELIRNDITDGEPGIPLWISANLYDITTGKPVEMHWEIWHCNATGTYSGVDSPINSNGDNLLNTTFLRGVTKTDKNGAATFETIFPGHYDGRAVHVHMIAHMDAVEYSNGTLGIGGDGNGNIAHVGKVFFDDSLIDQVDKSNPYTANEFDRNGNKDDREVGMMSQAGSPDPFMSYVYVGDIIQDGVYAWISIGIDASVKYNPERAAYLSEDGGVSTGNGPKQGPKHGFKHVPKHRTGQKSNPEFIHCSSSKHTPGDSSKYGPRKDRKLNCTKSESRNGYWVLDILDRITGSIF